MDLPITDSGERPAGKVGECFYCKAPVGRHEDDCVCVKKSVVIRMTIEYLVAVPRFWNEHDIEFHRNEGSWCADNDLEALVEWCDKQPNPGPCSCGAATFAFVRDATPEDHESMIDLVKK